MRTLLLPSLALCLLCQVSHCLAYEGEEYPEQYTSQGELYADEVPQDEAPPEVPQDQTYLDDQNQDDGYPEDQRDQVTQPDQADQPEPETDTNQEDLQAIRRMCQEYAEGLPDEEKAKYLEDCVRSQSY